MKKKLLSVSAFLFSGMLTLGISTVWSQESGSSQKGESGSSSQEGLSGSSQGAPIGGSSQENQSGSRKQGDGSSQQGMSERSQGRSVIESTADASDVKQAQQALKEKGHNPGPVDGILGPKTQQALRAFQQANSIQATGSLDSETKSKLGINGVSQPGKPSGAPESGASQAPAGGAREPSSPPEAK